MADAKKLIPFIIKWEGGFANNPYDRGGATNKGVTLATFRQYIGIYASVAQLKAMTDEQWEHIFRQGFWDAFHADFIQSQSVANICVDWAWNSGTRTVIKHVQRILGVAADGVVGNITLTAINKADPRQLFEKIKAARLAFVENIVKRDPTQKVHLKGWRNRINSITYTV